MQSDTLGGGFQDTAREAAEAFRCVMEAMARPGTTQTLDVVAPPAPLSPAAGAVLLTLCDADTPVYLAGAVDCDAVRNWLAFHTGAPLTGPAHCMFAVGAWPDLMPLSAYAIGTAEYPDRSATLIAELPKLDSDGTTMTGPGIADTAQLNLPDPGALAANQALYPLGLDFIFTCADRLAALPRSTTLKTAEVA